MKSYVTKFALASALVVSSLLPAFATTSLTGSATVTSTITVTLEDGSGNLLALDGATGNLNFGNVNAFASNYGSLSSPVDKAMMINTTNTKLN